MRTINRNALPSLSELAARDKDFAKAVLFVEALSGRKIDGSIRVLEGYGTPISSGVFSHTAWFLAYNSISTSVHELTHAADSEKPIRISDNFVSTTLSTVNAMLPRRMTSFREGRAVFAEQLFYGQPSRWTIHSKMFMNSFVLMGASLAPAQFFLSNTYYPPVVNRFNLVCLGAALIASLVGMAVSLTYSIAYNSIVTIARELDDPNRAFRITSQHIDSSTAPPWRAILFPKSFYKWEIIAAKMESAEAATSSA